MTTPMSQWRWEGHPGHLVVSYNCHFWLNTRVGDYRISTIGDWQPNANGVNEEIGAGRTHETFVFRVTGPDEGEVDAYNEIDSASYTDCEAARLGHMAMCRKYAAAVNPEPYPHAYYHPGPPRDCRDYAECHARAYPAAEPVR